MMVRTQFADPMSAARTLTKYLTDRHVKFSARPFNPHRPEETVWWVVPSSEWPAYRFGKYTFWKESSLLWCGFNVEKGLGSCAAKNYGTRVINKMTLSADWQWNSFLTDLREGKVAEALNQVQHASQSSVHIIIDISPMRDRDDHDFGTEGLHNASFQYDAGDLTLLVNNVSDPAWQELPAALSLVDMADWCLRPDLEWFWVVVNMVIPMEIPSGDISTGNLWGEHEIFDHVLAPFKPWVW